MLHLKTSCNGFTKDEITQKISLQFKEITLRFLIPVCFTLWQHQKVTGKNDEVSVKQI